MAEFTVFSTKTGKMQSQFTGSCATTLFEEQEKMIAIQLSTASSPLTSFRLEFQGVAARYREGHPPETSQQSSSPADPFSELPQPSAPPEDPLFSVEPPSLPVVPGFLVPPGCVWVVPNHQPADGGGDPAQLRSLPAKVVKAKGLNKMSISYKVPPDGDFGEAFEDAVCNVDPGNDDKYTVNDDAVKNWLVGTLVKGTLDVSWMAPKEEGEDWYLKEWLPPPLMDRAAQIHTVVVKQVFASPAEPSSSPAVQQPAAPSWRSPAILWLSKIAKNHVSLRGMILFARHSA